MGLMDKAVPLRMLRENVDKGGRWRKMHKEELCDVISW